MLSNQSASEYKSSSDYNVYYAYDKNDNITQVKVNNGLTSTYTYNDANLLTSLVHKNSSGTLGTYSYTYTIDGNMSKKVESGTTTNYTYDGSNRLLKESAVRNGVTTNMTYAYDTAGNRSKLTVTGSQNYITSYTYDKNNILLRESKVNSGSSYADLTIYSYDNTYYTWRKSYEILFR